MAQQAYACFLVLGNRAWGPKNHQFNGGKGVSHRAGCLSKAKAEISTAGFPRPGTAHAPAIASSTAGVAQKARTGGVSMEKTSWRRPSYVVSWTRPNVAVGNAGRGGLFAPPGECMD